SDVARSRRKRPDFWQHFLKAASRSAGTEIVAAELLEQLLVAVHDAKAAPDPGFGGESPLALTGGRESRGGRRKRRCFLPWRTSWEREGRRPSKWSRLSTTSATSGYRLRQAGCGESLWPRRPSGGRRCKTQESRRS